MNSGAPKGTSQAEVTSNSKKSNLYSLAIAKLCLSRQLVIQLNIFFKFCSNLLQAFRINLKALGYRKRFRILIQEYLIYCTLMQHSILHHNLHFVSIINRLNFGALLKSITGSFQSIINPSL